MHLKWYIHVVEVFRMIPVQLNPLRHCGVIELLEFVAVDIPYCHEVPRGLGTNSGRYVME